MADTPTIWRGLSQVNSRDGGFAQTESDIVALPDGGYLVVWEDRQYPGDTDMWGQRYDAAGVKVGNQFSVETVTDSQMVPALAAFPDGNVLVAFTDNFSGTLDTWVDRFDANLKHYPDPTSAHNILRDSIERWGWDSSDPQISVLSGGRYVVTYTIRAGLSPDTDDLDVYAQIMNADGSKGALVRVNTDAINADEAEVATLAGGNFVTVYRHERDRASLPGDHDVLFQIATASGILSRRIPLPAPPIRSMLRSPMWRH